MRPIHLNLVAAEAVPGFTRSRSCVVPEDGFLVAVDMSVTCQPSNAVVGWVGALCVASALETFSGQLTFGGAVEGPIDNQTFAVCRTHLRKQASTDVVSNIATQKYVFGLEIPVRAGQLLYGHLNGMPSCGAYADLIFFLSPNLRKLGHVTQFRNQNQKDFSEIPRGVENPRRTIRENPVRPEVEQRPPLEAGDNPTLRDFLLFDRTDIGRELLRISDDPLALFNVRNPAWREWLGRKVITLEQALESFGDAESVFLSAAEVIARNEFDFADVGGTIRNPLAQPMLSATQLWALLAGYMDRGIVWLNDNRNFISKLVGPEVENLINIDPNFGRLVNSPATVFVISIILRSLPQDSRRKWMKGRARKRDNSLQAENP